MTPKFEFYQGEGSGASPNIAISKETEAKINAFRGKKSLAAYEQL